MARRPSRRIVLWAGAVLAAVAAAYVLHTLGGGDGFGLISATGGDWAYLAVFVCVFGDAVIPILPGETALNAAATIAAQGGLDLGLVIVLGSLGAILGDSALYWIARLSRRRIEPRLAAAERNEKVALALGLIGSSAPLLIVAGRYVPGLRFVVNATMGLSRYPYRRFLLWSAIGGTLWAAYTCGLAYLVATALAEFPLASVVISATITTAAIGVVFIIVRRRRRSVADHPARVMA